jgi:hypothetical protein
MFAASLVCRRLPGVLQPCLRRIYPANFNGNRILAIRPVLSWATMIVSDFRCFGLPPKSGLWRGSQYLQRCGGCGLASSLA